jgi:RND superfamily putative drug exporter
VLPALGRLIAGRARWFVLTWALLVGLGFAAATGALGSQSLFDRLQAADAPQVPGESLDGLTLLQAADTSGPTVHLLLDGVDPASTRLRDLVVAAAAELAAIEGVVDVAHPYRTQTEPTGPTEPTRPTEVGRAPSPLVATDGHAVLVTVSLAGQLPDETRQAAPDAVATRLAELGIAVRDTEPAARPTVGSVGMLVDEINSSVESDLRRGEAIALPVSLLVMVLVFGGLLAAGLPIVGAVASIGGGLACLLGFSHAIELDSSVPSVVSVLGLGLCIDYGLLLVSRFREELRRLIATGPVGLRDDGDGSGADGQMSPAPEQVATALERTLGTAGRTVLFSAVTVAASLAGLLMVNASILRAVGAAGVSVVVVALLVALTLVPALIAMAGGRLIRPGVLTRVPVLARLARRLGDVAPAQGAFSRLASRVQRRPILVIIGVVAVLVVAAVPVLSIRLVSTGIALLPTSSAQRQLFEAMETRFPASTQAPILVVAPGTPPAAVDAWARTSVDGLPGVASVDPARVVGTGPTAVTVLGVRTATPAQSDQARAVVRRVRGVRPAFTAFVTGESAAVADFSTGIVARAPYAIGLVVLVTFVLLFAMTGSILVPLKALAMNVVSLGASFGVLVWVFQLGHLESLLGFSSAGGIDTTVPALALAFAFGLSMDYEVFLLSRIKEYRDQGHPNDAAVRHGLQRSGRIITSAALVVVIVFAGFVAGRLLVIKQVGVALAVAVAVDATLVRMLLVPATMTLLGEWNWWAPGPLRRLHERFGVRES